MSRPRIGRSLKAVVDVDGVERRQGLGFCEVGEQVQQDGGVEAATKSDTPGGGVAP
ncbi:hypothetical protein D3C84_1297300 [compost metagenome]